MSQPSSRGRGSTTRRAWSDVEDQALIESVAKWPNSWRSVCLEFGKKLKDTKRTAGGCQARYEALRKADSSLPESTAELKWNAREDQELIDAYAAWPNDYKKMADAVKPVRNLDRSASVAKTRYTELRDADPSLLWVPHTMTLFTDKEFERIGKMLMVVKSWDDIAAAFPNKGYKGSSVRSAFVAWVEISWKDFPRYLIDEGGAPAAGKSK